MPPTSFPLLFFFFCGFLIPHRHRSQVVCVAVLSWIRVIFTDPEYWEVSLRDKFTVEHLMNIVMMVPAFLSLSLSLFPLPSGASRF